MGKEQVQTIPVPIGSFSSALEAIKLGKKVSRKGWNGKGMYIYLWECLDTHYEANIVMFTADKKHQPGWLASQADMLAMDWDIVE
jgi:hypothetical protein